MNREILNTKSGKIAMLAMLTVLSLILTYLESVFSLTVTIPGVKLGLANIAVLMAMYIYDAREAVVVTICKILFVTIFFGNMYSLLYAITGALFSLVAMILCVKIFDLNIIVVSMYGGLFHNIGQLIVARLILSSIALSYYLPVMTIGGIICGLIVGIITIFILKLTKLYNLSGVYNITKTKDLQTYTTKDGN